MSELSDAWREMLKRDQRVLSSRRGVRARRGRGRGLLADLEADAEEAHERFDAVLEDVSWRARLRAS